MAYQPSAFNKRNVPGGAECTVLIVDDAGIYPTIRNEMQFPGKTVSQLTTGFLAPFVKSLAAQAIQTTILQQANVLLDNLVVSRWLIDVVPALSTFDANVRSRLAQSNIDETTIQNKILNQWAAYNVSAVLTSPTVQIVLDHNVTAVNDSVVVS